MKKAFRNFILILLGTIIVAILASQSDTARKAVTYPERSTGTPAADRPR